MRHILILAAIGAAILSAACSGDHDCAIDPGVNEGGSANEGGGGEGGTATVPQNLSYCDAVCECEACPPAQLQACNAEQTEIENDAITAGCTAEHAAFEHCLEGGQCIAGSYEVDCTPSFWDLSECIDFYEPEPTTCDAAAEICGAGEGGTAEECQGAALCAAECIVDLGCDIENNVILQDCITACAM